MLIATFILAIKTHEITLDFYPYLRLLEWLYSQVSLY